VQKAGQAGNRLFRRKLTVLSTGNAPAAAPDEGEMRTIVGHFLSMTDQNKMASIV
jgi:hypothetical protein